MSEESLDTYRRRSNRLLPDKEIPGVHPLARSITEAHESGVLFFLAVEVELLLEQYFKKNGLPPTPVDLEIILAEAAKAMIGE